MTYLSDPPGGTLYKQNGEPWGPCPKVLWYDVSEEALASGKLQVKGLIVRWPSGLEKRSDDMITFSLDGNAQQFTFVQTSDAPVNQQTPEHTDHESATIDRVTAEHDPGPREESEEPNAAATRTIMTEELVTVDFGDGVLMDFVLIPSGEFLIRFDPNENGDDSNQNPTQRVRITKAFYMGRYEVTQEQYEKIMGVNPANFKGPKRPVETVSWHEAKRFCEKLSSTVDGLFRLPTEAEWEYACRAGTTTTYYWGDDFDSRYARTIADRESGTANVGTRLPNAWGLYDMSGNVWEWCADWYKPHDTSLAESIDPQGPSSSDFKVLRGGSWGSSQR
ncbi:MAG: formylglycine-generating enzyme family protein, partial [Phycisphaerales bacterium]